MSAHRPPPTEDFPERSWPTQRLALFRRKLLRWYRTQRRDLPWRRTTDPYRIWVSETMLQQTQVATVIPYYERFVARFPTPAALAAANIDEVLSYWSGLGYYRRIRNLHAAVRIIQEQHAGRVPDDPETLLHLPGIGRYTAGAILSIGFGKAQPVLDGNVIRVLCRLFAIFEDPQSTSTQRRLWGLAEELLAPRTPGDFNQGLMELGAIVCQPRAPRCDDCPVAYQCQARQLGRQEDLPRLRRSERSESIRMAAILIERQGCLLLCKRGKTPLLENLWEVPTVELEGTETNRRRQVADLVRRHYGLRLEEPESIGQARHGITFRRITLEVYRAKLAARESPRCSEMLRWVRPHDLRNYGLSALTLKAVRLSMREQATDQPVASR